MKYNDLDATVRSCLMVSYNTPTSSVYLAKSDLMSAFRMLPNQYYWIIIKCEDPRTGITGCG